MAAGRTSLPSRFCSRMCAHQPAVRPHVNIAGIILAGTPAKSRMTAAQNSTLVSMARSGRRSRSSASAACSSAAATSKRGASSRLAVARSTRARGSSARYTRWPKPISLSPRSRMPLTTARASPVFSTSSIIGSTRAGAPPCSGPLIAPTAPDSAAATSAPVEAITRAVNVDAFIPCSAAVTQYASMASTCLGSGSPCQRVMKRAVTVEHSSIRRCGTAGW